MPEIKLDGVVIESAELLHPKMIAVIEWFMENEKDHGLERIIVKHEKGPKGMFGKYFPELNLFIINLEHILDDAIAKAMKEKDDIISLAGLIWLNMLWTPGHEFHHAVAFSMDDGALLDDDDWLRAEEEEADDYADECIIELARVRPDLIEPPSLGEMPYFGLEVMARIISSIQKGEDWAELHRDMDAKGEIYAGKNFSLTSLREYIRMGQGGPDWEEAPVELKAKEAAVGETVQVEETVALLPVQQELPISDGEDDGIETNVVEYQGDLDAIANGGYVQEEVPVGLADEYVSDPVIADAAATATATGPAVHPDFAAPVAPAIAMDPATVQTVHTIFKRLISHLFTLVWDPRGMWKDAKGLWTPIDISNIPGSEIVMAYQTNETTGDRPTSVPAAGQIVGRTFKNATFPGYDIIMNIGGTRFARRIMVQNPWTRSKYAPMAQNGEQIAWILDMDIQGNDAWKGHYHNGVWNPK